MAFILEFWHWFALALIFIVIEALLMSGVFFAFTVSSSISGMILWLYPEIAPRDQLMIFASLSVICVFAIRKVFAKKYAEADADNESTAKLVGKNFVLKLPIQNGFGEVELDGKNWAIKGRDQKAGTSVTVVDTDGHFLSVFPFKPETVNTEKNADASNINALTAKTEK